MIGVGVGRSNGTRPSRALTAARWLLVVPAALGASALMLWVLGTMAERRYPIWQPTWFVLLTVALVAASFVVAGALVAPSRRRRVALVAATVFAAGALVLSLLFAVSSNWSFATSGSWAIVALAVAIAAAYGAALVIGSRRA